MQTDLGHRYITFTISNRTLLVLVRLQGTFAIHAEPLTCKSVLETIPLLQKCVPLKQLKIRDRSFLVT